jgi:hypothetical protein
VRDQGRRTEVTGGKQLDGFLWLIQGILKASGIRDAEVFCGPTDTYLPGFFRPTKRWDLVAVADGNLLVSIEVKSQAGPSYGNNFNNRIEEAVGNAHDFWRAYQVGAFKAPIKPVLGYMMLLEDDDASNAPVRIQEPHFNALPEFRDASYALRYQIFCQKALREGLYDAAAFLMSNQKTGLRGQFQEPCFELRFRALAAAVYGHGVAYRKQHAGPSE